MDVVKIDKVMAALRKKHAESRRDGDATAVVGYTAAYALYVHENLEARHKEGKQAKFLEQPARELSNSGELKRIIRTMIGSGKTLAQALLSAALRIQRESQKIVPVLTGNLKGSAFTRLE